MEVRMLPRSLLIAGLAALAALAALTTSPAFAHFRLVDPPPYSQQDTLGNPQKSSPCGPTDASNPSDPTGAITVVQQGSMLAITIDETIFHPGHYRVSIAQDPAGLPAEPAVTAGTTDCGSAVIDPSPTLPVLADGVLEHTSAFAAEQTAMVQLPAGFTCSECTLQVLEFMANHGAPCFYYHCAKVTVTADPVPDAGPTPDAGGAGGGGDDLDGDGCGCRTTGSHGAGLGTPALCALALAALRRRRRTGRC
jgi:MYXO-CTERM domain-containing protein